MKKRLIIFSTLIALLCGVNVYAEEDMPLTVSSQEDIQMPEQTEEAFYAGDDVTVDKNVNASTFVAGQTVNVNSEINGITFAAGNTVNVKGKSHYGFIAGNIITYTASSDYDLFIAGNSITIGSGATIGRDLFIAGNTIKINTNVGRNLNVGGTSLDISGVRISGNIDAAVEELIMDENTEIVGKLTYYEGTKVTGLDKAKVESKEVKKSVSNVTISFGVTLYEHLFSALSGFLVLVALLYIAPRTKKNIDKIKLNSKDVLSNMGKGLIALIVIPFLIIIGMITGLLLPLSLIVTALYVIGIYLSTLLSAYIIGSLINDKLFGKKDNMIISAFIGVLLVKLIGLVPLVGALVSIVCLLYGIGLEYNLIIKDK